jgi:hypothetical protein
MDSRSSGSMLTGARPDHRRIRARGGRSAFHPLGSKLDADRGSTLQAVWHHSSLSMLLNGFVVARMVLVNPFADDPERGGAFEQGYLAGYAEPDANHSPPLEGELLDIFFQGETAGRDDRQQEAAGEPAVPVETSSDFSRFESAPDGTLIPVPNEYPPGVAVREDAQVRVSTLGQGFSVAIYNGSPFAVGDPAGLLVDLASEVAQAKLERMLAEAAASGARGLVKFGGLVVGVLISIFTPSPILQETRFRGFLPDGRPVAYVVLTPQT